MKIAQIAPLWERVPPPGYGGIELVVGLLSDELVRRGHEVTLFASGDSQTLARLESVVSQAIRLNSNIREPGVYEMLQLQRVVELSLQFDLIHFHTGYSALPWAEVIQTPVIHTIHGTFTPDGKKLYKRYRKQNYISISDAQREPEWEINYVRTVYNGIDMNNYPFFPKPQNPPYLAFLGRLSPEKGIQHAIAIARATGWHLKIAGKIDAVDRKFYEREIKPFIDGQQIEYLGEIDHHQKGELIGNAAVTLFPITRREPFGLVMIESMSTGTPVIGMNMGSVPEVIAHGETGFICNTIEEIIAAIPAAVELDRQACRDRVLNHFSVAKMVEEYEAAYAEVIEASMSKRNGHMQSHQLVA